MRRGRSANLRLGVPHTRGASCYDRHGLSHLAKTGMQPPHPDSLSSRTQISNRHFIARLETSVTSTKQTAAPDSNRHNRAASASRFPIFPLRISSSGVARSPISTPNTSKSRNLKIIHLTKVWVCPDDVVSGAVPYLTAKTSAASKDGIHDHSRWIYLHRRSSRVR